VGLDEAAALLVLIAQEDSAKLDTAAVRFPGRACLERSFITLGDPQLLVACLAQLPRADESRGRYTCKTPSSWDAEEASAACAQGHRKALRGIAKRHP
jgi:hypothetical protein